MGLKGRQTAQNPPRAGSEPLETPLGFVLKALSWMSRDASSAPPPLTRGTRSFSSVMKQQGARDGISHTLNAGSRRGSDIPERITNAVIRGLLHSYKK